MISYICNPLLEPFDYETVSDCLRRYAQNTPDKEAIVFYSPDLSRRSITFADIYKNACTTTGACYDFYFFPSTLKTVFKSTRKRNKNRNKPLWYNCKRFDCIRNTPR